ncbi:hypothetical protein B0T10DRAFT_573908 [Thelonectria olida]|uniref:Uncharacterized protein n=1 Tax=Thelonectria olida TaxID=1576542 RepID=A0A9P8W4Y2_9HYPO|nr:hypothetical protein B0T10DRAFT_573908 [Thelonectria olida]
MPGLRYSFHQHQLGCGARLTTLFGSATATRDVVGRDGGSSSDGASRRVSGSAYTDTFSPLPRWTLCQPKSLGLAPISHHGLEPEPPTKRNSPSLDLAPLIGRSQTRLGPPIAHVRFRSREQTLMRKTHVKPARLHLSRDGPVFPGCHGPWFFGQAANAITDLLASQSPTPTLCSMGLVSQHLGVRSRETGQAILSPSTHISILPRPCFART